MKQKLAVTVVALVLALAGAELLLRLGGRLYYQAWMRKEQQYIDIEDMPYREAAAREKVADTRAGLRTVVCVGDSWTFGMEASPGNAYPTQLQRLLNRENPGKYLVYNCGVPGSTSTKLLKYLPGVMKRYKPDMVVLLVGVNDTYNPFPSELHLISGKPGRLTDALADLRIYKVATLGVEQLHRKIRLHNLRRTAIKHEINPVSRAYCARIDELRNAGEYERALRMLENVMKVDANNEDAYMLLAKVYHELGRYSESADACGKLIALNPYTKFRGEVYRLLFLLYQKENSPKDAIRTIAESIASDEMFKNPGMPFVMRQEMIDGNLQRNLETIIKMIQSGGAIPILQVYPLSQSSLEKELAGKYGIPFVDHGNFRKLENYTLYFKRTHPNDKGYRLMAENVYNAIRAIKE